MKRLARAEEDGAIDARASDVPCCVYPTREDIDSRTTAETSRQLGGNTNLHEGNTSASAIGGNTSHLKCSLRPPNDEFDLYKGRRDTGPPIAGELMFGVLKVFLGTVSERDVHANGLSLASKQ